MNNVLLLSEVFPEPTAHEVWVRDRIKWHTQYDPADDGPETNWEFRRWTGLVIEQVALVQLVEDVLDSENWLNPHSHQFGDDGHFPMWERTRE